MLPYLGSEGTLIAANYDLDLFPNFSFMSEERLAELQTWETDFPADAEEWRGDDGASIVAFHMGSMPAELEGSADAVFFARVLHNMARFENQGVASFGSSNAEVLGIAVDVTDRAALERAADQTEEAFGAIHVVCNNAGVAVGGSVDDMSYEDWDWVMGVNLDGVINGVQVFIEPDQASRRGWARRQHGVHGGAQFAIPRLSVVQHRKQVRGSRYLGNA